MSATQLQTAAPDQRNLDQHLHPLDSVIIACESLSESPCTWCQAVMGMLRRHLESYIPAFEEGRN